LQNLQGIRYLVRKGGVIPDVIEGQVEEISGYPATKFRDGTRK
jgi:hypothetical protein